MRKFIPILICIFLSTANSAIAQKKRNKNAENVTATISVDDAIKQYKFTEAIEQLNIEIENLELDGKDTEKAEKKLHIAEKGEKMMNAIEKVTFIDSLVVPQAELFKHLACSNEVGSVYSYQDFFKKDTPSPSSVFLSQMRDKIYYAETGKDAQFRLFTRDLIGNKWGDAVSLNGLNEEGDIEQMNYPYVLSDGITLYFAAQGSGSIGGYDIFMTRYDADDHSFLTPENIGMPFNSPANDYLYMVDDFLNLGWFVTDRNQKEGYVCIYTFIPNDSRKVYNSFSFPNEKLISLAKITSIKSTWGDKTTVDEAITKLHNLKSDANRKGKTDQKHLFIINDATVYSKASDFHSTEARKQYEYWLESQKELTTLEANLEKLRKQYDAKKPDAEVAKQIYAAENKLRMTITAIQKIEKETRALELKAKQ